METKNKHCEKCRSGYTQSPLKDLCENCPCHKEKCNKCDERGMIVEIKDGGHHGHSCDCGKYGRYIKAKFNEKFGGDPVEQINNLLNYGRQRIEEKSKLV
jgi:hypothetical protein